MLVDCFNDELWEFKLILLAKVNADLFFDLIYRFSIKLALTVLIDDIECLENVIFMKHSIPLSIKHSEYLH